MVRVYGAGSHPVNGPNDPFVLTHDQLWQALQRKIRNPSEFVAALSNCKVHSDENGVVKRSVLLDFKEWGTRPMSETVSCYGDLWIRFVQSEGSVSINLISYYPEVSETSLMLTYMFEWEVAGVQEGTESYNRLVKYMSEMATMAVIPDLHSLPEGWRPFHAVRNNGPDNLAIERYKLRELAEGWPMYRDACEWDNFLSIFHPDAYVYTTWTGRCHHLDFIAASKAGMDNGAFIMHRCHGSSTDINLEGTRAVTKMKATITQRFTLDGCEVLILISTGEVQHGLCDLNRLT